MFNIIYSEFLKLKKSYIMIIVLIGGLTSSASMVLGNKLAGITMPFEKFAFNIQGMNLLILYVVIFSLTAGYVFSREFADKTASIVYTYPISKMKIFIAKLIIIYMLIFLVYLLQIITTILSYYIADGILVSGNIVINNIKANIVSMLFQFLLIPIPILIANMSKNIMLPIIYGIIGFMMTAFFGTSDFIYAKYFPLLTPYFSAKYFYEGKFSDFNCLIIIGITCFILSMIICIYQYNKEDII